MSLVFKPTLPASLKAPVVKRRSKRTPWDQEEIETLIELRLLGASLAQCGKALGRSADMCRGAVQKQGLVAVIRARRRVIINAYLDKI